MSLVDRIVSGIACFSSIAQSELKSARGNEPAQEMSRLLKLLRFRDLKYRGNDFSVHSRPTVREGASSPFTRQGADLNLSAR
jgi:hypothetical protein